MLHLDMHHRTPAPSDWRLKDVPLTTLVSAARHCANADLSCEADRASQDNVNPPSSTQLPLSPHNVFPPCLLDDVAEEPGFDDRDLCLPCATAVCDGRIPVGLPDLRDRCLCPDVAAAAAAIPSPNHQRTAAVLFGHVTGADIAWNGHEGPTPGHLAATTAPHLVATMPDRRAAPGRQRIGAVHHKFQAPLQWFPYCSAPDVSAALLPPIAVTSRGDFHCNGAHAERASEAAVAEETKSREAWCSLSPRLSEVCRVEIPAKFWTEYQRNDTLLSMGYSRFTVRNTPRSLDIVELGLMLMQHFTQCAHTFGIADENNSPLVANVSMLTLPIRGGRTKAHDQRGGSSAAWGTLAAGEARDTRVFIWIRRDVAQNDEVMGLFKFSSFVFGPQVNKLSLQRNDPPMSSGK